MKLARRSLIKAGLASSGAIGFAPLARALALADVAIHDSRWSFAAPAPAGRVIDLVDERRNCWATIRSGMGRAQRIEGLALWSDYVMIAHELERRGFRRAAETRQGRLWRFTLLRQNQRIERDNPLA